MGVKNCQNPNLLEGICTLQRMLEIYLNRKDFYIEELNDLLEEEYPIVVKNGLLTTPEESSNLLVSVIRGASQMQGVGGLNTTSRVVAYFTSNIEVHLSSKNPRVTELLTLDLSQFLFTEAQYSREHNLSYNTLNISNTEFNRDQNPNFYTSKIQIPLSIPKVSWQLPEKGCILRSIQIQTQIKE